MKQKNIQFTCYKISGSRKKQENIIKRINFDGYACRYNYVYNIHQNQKKNHLLIRVIHLNEKQSDTFENQIEEFNFSVYTENITNELLSFCMGSYFADIYLRQKERFKTNFLIEQIMHCFLNSIGYTYFNELEFHVGTAYSNVMGIKKQNEKNGTTRNH